MKPTITALEHYDRLADMGNGLNDPPSVQEFMSRWDGPLFWKAIGDTGKKDILEVGIGCGRIARQLLKFGCRSLTGLDISPKTIEVARSQLSGFSNMKLILDDISQFRQPASFDIVCSVLTFMHVHDKRKALTNILDCLRPGGHIVLSIDNASDSFDFGEWMIPLYPWSPERYFEVLNSIGYVEVELIPLTDTWSGPEGQKMETYGEQMATVVRASKRLR